MKSSNWNFMQNINYAYIFLVRMSISMNRFTEESTTLKKLRITKLGLTHKEEFRALALQLLLNQLSYS